MPPPEEIEKLVLWLEAPGNLARVNGKTLETKIVWMRDLESLFPHQSFKQVYNKFDNYKKSWKEAHNWNKQTGWGLTEDDLGEGTAGLRKKLLKKCPMFFRLEKIFGDRPNVDPPAMFHSGDTSVGAGALLGRISNAIEDADERESIPSNDEPNSGPTSKSSALQRGTKQNIWESLSLDSEDDGNDRFELKRKRTRGSALAHAVLAFLEVRSQRDDKRFKDDRALKSKEMDLNERRLALEERKVANEERRLELSMLQLRNGNSGNNAV
ncbi:hypothetical protein RUND412_009770 [Rhizina undulata]